MSAAHGDLARAATARQIAREFAGLDPGPGFDVAPAPLLSSLPPLSADEIKWEMERAETIQADGSPLRASLIAYRELALAGVMRCVAPTSGSITSRSGITAHWTN